MVAQRQELARREFNFVPTTLKEAQEYATIFANSGLCPAAYKGRPNDILIVWQIGGELGIGKAQALRTFGCINGIPFAYGDGKFALVKRHREFEDAKEWFEGNLKDETLTAFCTIKRKNQEPVTRSFSVTDAKIANLWKKSGPWTSYPRRMLQHRARGFAVNDSFPDAFFGIHSEDEALNIVEATPIVEVTPQGKGMSGLEETLGIESTTVEGEFIEASEPDELNKLNELNELIARLNVTKSAITVTLKKFGVETIDGLSEEQIDIWMTHLKNKESKQ